MPASPGGPLDCFGPTQPHPVAQTQPEPFLHHFHWALLSQNSSVRKYFHYFHPFFTSLSQWGLNPEDGFEWLKENVCQPFSCSSHVLESSLAVSVGQLHILQVYTPICWLSLQKTLLLGIKPNIPRYHPKDQYATGILINIVVLTYYKQINKNYEPQC